MSLDLLNLSENDKIRKVLQKHTDDNLLEEIVVYSNYVTKINRKSKQQKRVFCLTNKAVYNFNGSYQLKRRIALHQIHTISVSSSSNDIVLHIPTEYDYLYRVDNKQYVDDIIRITYESATKAGHHINVLLFELKNLALIAENDKAKIPQNQSADQYMLLKLCSWQQVYKIHSYKQQHIENGVKKRRSLVYKADQKNSKKFSLSMDPEFMEEKKENEQKQSPESDNYIIQSDDNDNDDDYIRNDWECGSQLEVYSHSNKKWFNGKICEVYNDDLGEWFVIQYGDDMEKDLQRDDKDLRPLTKYVEMGTQYSLLNRMGSTKSTK